MTHRHPQLLFGGASIGAAFSTLEQVSELLQTLQSLGIHRIDTAARYPPTDPGASERLLGESGAASKGFAIDTKIFTPSSPDGHLEPTAIEKSLAGSYGRLKLGSQHKLRVLYCHRPDPITPLVKQAEALNAQHQAGMFDVLGVSNFDAELLTKFIAICEDNGYIKPTVYQGQYNLIYRSIEKTLFPTLREHGLVFNAYSPLAGGFLNGRLTSGDTEGSRFEAGNVMGQGYRMIYDKAESHAAVHSLNNILQSLGISKVEASLRWLAYHSELGPEDGIIIGASKLDQVKQNVEAISKGPLDDKVASAINELWTSIS